VKGKSKSWYPAVDIMDEGDSIVLNVDLPGILKEDMTWMPALKRGLTIALKKNQAKEEVKKSPLINLMI
jgi:HSP20 family molecular chaperone IbpA